MADSKLFTMIRNEKWENEVSSLIGKLGENQTEVVRNCVTISKAIVDGLASYRDNPESFMAYLKGIISVINSDIFN